METCKYLREVLATHYKGGDITVPYHECFPCGTCGGYIELATNDFVRFIVLVNHVYFLKDCYCVQFRDDIATELKKYIDRHNTSERGEYGDRNVYLREVS